MRIGCPTSLLLLGVAGWVAGCKPSAANAPPAPATSAPAPAGWLGTNAQPKLSTVKLWLGPQELTAEVALTERQVATGMMFRRQMEEHEAMLFVFSQPHRASFYMRNTLIPLSGAYIDHRGVILEIRDMKPLDETPIVARSDAVQYVLEVKQGWFKRNRLGVGTLVRTEVGSLAETFTRRR